MNKQKTDINEIKRKILMDRRLIEEDEPEPFGDVIDSVAKRFNFKTREKVTGSGKPERYIIPFYSHETDIYSDLENNYKLFEDSNEESLHIGILERINPNRSIKLPSSDEYTNDSEFIISIIKYISDIILTEMINYVNPKEVIELHKRRNERSNYVVSIAISVFNVNTVDTLNYLKDIYKSISFPNTLFENQIKNTILSFINHIYDSMLKINDYIADVGSIIIEDIFKEVLNDNKITHETALKYDPLSIYRPTPEDSVCKIKEFKLIKYLNHLLSNSEKLSASEFEEEYTYVNNNIFDFSCIVANRIGRYINYKRIKQLIQSGTYDIWRVSLPEDIKIKINEFDIRLYETINENILNKLKITSVYDVNLVSENNNDVTDNINKYLDKRYDISKVPNRNIYKGIPRWE